MKAMIQNLYLTTFAGVMLSCAIAFAQPDERPEMPTGEPDSEEDFPEQESNVNTDTTSTPTLGVAPADITIDKSAKPSVSTQQTNSLNPDETLKSEAWITPLELEPRISPITNSPPQPSIVIQAYEQPRRGESREKEAESTSRQNTTSRGPTIDTPLKRNKKKDPGNLHRTSGRNNYRSAKIKTHAELKRLRDVHGVKTIINLARDSMRDQKDKRFGCNRKKYCEPKWADDLGLNYVSVYLGDRGPSDPDFRKIKRLLDEGDVLVHCRHGADRTGAVLGRYRIEKGEINKTEALREALSMGFKPRTHPGYGRGPDPNRHLRRWMLDNDNDNDIDMFQAPFSRFVMQENAAGAKSTELSDNPKLWDKKFYDLVVDSSHRIAGQSQSWKRFELAKKDYISVLNKVRSRQLPELFAAIPFQETRYLKGLTSVSCASGIWQLKPETARHLGLKVNNCKIDGFSQSWTPQKSIAAPHPKDAVYVVQKKNKFKCQIKDKGRCAKDERFNINKATDAMLELFDSVYNNKRVQASGAAVQITTLANNHGWGINEIGRPQPTILDDLKTYMKKNKDGSRFYGDNITCSRSIDAYKASSFDKKCGGQLGVQTQRYGYEVVARHFAAVCYYTENYPKDKAFKPWMSMDRSFCQALQTPKKESLDR